MRLTVLGSKVHALEIERRAVSAANDGTESAVTRPETFRGVLVRFDPGEDATEWLFELVSALRHQRGIVHRVLAHLGDPSNAVWYQHRFTEDEVAPGERTSVNALGRLGHGPAIPSNARQEIVGELVQHCPSLPCRSPDRQGEALAQKRADERGDADTALRRRAEPQLAPFLHPMRISEDRDRSFRRNVTACFGRT